MIFVTVGNAHHGSLRLLNAVESLAAAGEFGDEKVITQSGNNPDFKPQYCENRPFVNMDEFHELVREARVVICHAGAGTLSAVLRTSKTPVVMPRRLKYNEIVDDHQPELLEAFASRGLVVPAYEVDDLPRAIREAAERAPVAVPSVNPGVEKVSQAVRELLGESSD
jgi:UDP-N-acetylglucosamine transferase subunit ALG13